MEKKNEFKHFAFSPFQLQQPAYDRNYWRNVWTTMPLWTLLVILIVAWGSKNSSEIIWRLVLESLFNYLLIFLAAKGKLNTKPKGVLMYVSRITIGFISGMGIQAIGGTEAPIWFWNIHCLVCCCLYWGAAKSVWLIVEIIMRCVIDFTQSYHVADRSLYQSILTVSVNITVGALFFKAMYYTASVEDELVELLERNEIQNEHIKGIISSIPDVVVVVDKDLNISFMRNEFNGISPNKFIGKSIWNIIKQEKPKASSKLSMVFKTGKPQNWTWKHQSRGTLSIYEVKATAIFKNQVTRSAALFFSNITDRVISQQRKTEAEKYELESKVKSEFISTLSHEIRNPLQSIMYSLQILSYSKLDKVCNDCDLSVNSNIDTTPSSRRP